ncbi:methanol dehydrogenase [Novosphingobium sp. PC22D]|uniref:TPM domain-containing protein n=1 Tax=Novosphingobium sp. PC22D TaxID=1962403 RepID=UPI000BF1EA08|nr:TPM domain-containing protein [Novosphingobium sp. PC22D]PEQ11496.1 methanol dehydrogenase [Novosphingobium sp. PC22D]
MRAAIASLLLLIGAALVSPLAAAPEFPKLTGRVTDAANVIPADVEARLESKLADLDRQTHRQLVIATLPSLQGYEISDYGYQLGRAWGIGDKERNDGALLIVAPNERKVRIEVGYGLEPVITDGFSSDVVRNLIVPRFKAGDLPGGIEAGADALITQLQLPPEEAARIAAEADREPEGINLGTVIFFLFVFFFFILPILRAASGRRGGRRRGFGGPIIWAPGMFSGGSSGGGWSGGGGFGGGFSGGGGSFGGGGASGSW